jgi:hypothetical protein
MAPASSVFTISRVAEILGEDEDWLVVDKGLGDYFHGRQRMPRIH